MAWDSLCNEAEIKRIFDSIIQGRSNIEVHIPGEEETFFSGIKSIAGNGVQRLALRSVSPEIGNQRIQASFEVEVFFSFRRFLCRFRAPVLSATGMNGCREILIGYPRMLEVEEKRKEERLYPDFPDFLSAVLTHTDKNRKTRTYDLRVLNYSRHGLGLLVEEEAHPLLGELKQGDFIPDITLFGEALIVRLSAFVRHKSEISEGPFAGSYVVGLESEAGLEEHFDDLSSKGASTSAS